MQNLQRTHTESAGKSREADIRKGSDRISEQEAIAASGAFAQLVFYEAPASKPSTANVTATEKALPMMSSAEYVYSKSTIKDAVSEIDASGLDRDIFKNLENAPPGQTIKFSLLMPNQREISIQAIENPTHWAIKMSTHDSETRKKVEKSRRQLNESLQKSLGKKVVIDVE